MPPLTRVHAVEELAEKSAETQLKKMVMTRAWLQKPWTVVFMATKKMWFVVGD